MNTNCLITKLKEVVNNDSLLRFDEIAVPVNTGSFNITPSKSINVRSDKPALSLTSGGAGSKSVVVPAGTISSSATRVYVTEACTVYIPQYDLLRFNISPTANIECKNIGTNSERVIISLTNSNDLRYDLGTLPKSTFEVFVGQYFFNLNFDSYPVLRKMLVNYGSLVNVDFSELAEKAPLLEYLNIASTQSGSLDDLGKCKSLVEARNIVRGTIEGFVTSERTAYGERAARTSGSVVIVGPKITFQGTAIGSGDHNLSWTADTITLDGTTINA